MKFQTRNHAHGVNTGGSHSHGGAVSGAGGHGHNLGNAGAHGSTTLQLLLLVNLEPTKTYLLTWVYSTLFVSSKEPVLNT